MSLFFLVTLRAHMFTGLKMNESEAIEEVFTEAVDKFTSCAFLHIWYSVFLANTFNSRKSAQQLTAAEKLDQQFDTSFLIYK